MKDNKQLVNNIIGQLEGVKKMIEEDKECVNIITQLKASKSAINTTMNRLIEEHSKNCLKGLDQKDKKKISSLLDELIKRD